MNKRIIFLIIGGIGNPILFCQLPLTNLTEYAIIQLEGKRERYSWRVFLNSPSRFL